MEELKDPHVNLLRALMISIFGVTIVYLSVNIAYLAVLSPEEMISSEAVAVVKQIHYKFKLYKTIKRCL